MEIKDIKYEGLGIYRIDMQPNNGTIIKFEAKNIQDCKQRCTRGTNKIKKKR